MMMLGSYDVLKIQTHFHTWGIVKHNLQLGVLNRDRVSFSWPSSCSSKFHQLVLHFEMYRMSQPPAITLQVSISTIHMNFNYARY